MCVLATGVWTSLTSLATQAPVVSLDAHGSSVSLAITCWSLATSSYAIYRLGVILHTRFNQVPNHLLPTDAQSVEDNNTRLDVMAPRHPAKDEALQHSAHLPSSLFQQAINHASNGLVICDAQQPTLPIVYVSPSFEALTGYSAGDILGQNCRFLQGEETEQVGIDTMRQAIAHGSGCKVLLRNYHKSGRAFWNEITLSPLKNEAGVVTHYVGTQIDISHYLETFKALQESESRYRYLYEATPAMLHSVNAQGRIVSVSHDWLEKLGYEQHEVIGQPLTKFVAIDFQVKIARILSNLSATNVCRDKLFQFIKKNGDRMDVLLSTIAEGEGDDCNGSSMGVLVDITERKKAKERLRRSEALLRSINNLPPTGIFVMDCQTDEALFINSEFYRIWQLEHLQEQVVRGDITGEQLLTECLSNIDLGTFVATSTAEDFTEGNKIVEDEVPLLDGRTLRRIYGPIQENNSTFAYLYVFEDITERKQAVQKLAQATKAAEAANCAKSEFLANMSHELRSPLNAILGFTHILKSSDPSPEQQENLDIIYNSGEHLLALINDILDISKIEAGHVTLTESEFDLYRLLDELQQVFQQAVREKGLQLIVERSLDLPRIIYSDRLKLRQILINLLSNAVKFTQSGSITLKTVTSASYTTSSSTTDRHTLKQREHNALHQLDLAPSQTISFAVIDTGTGIAQSDQTRLFEAFVQTESGLTAAEGTGLGLTISYEYVQLLGGQLTVCSTLDVGSTFAFDLSVKPIQNTFDQTAPLLAEPQGRIVGLKPNQPTYKILVVDDVALNRKLLTHLLRGISLEVQEANNGKEAVEQWKAWQPDLIWMDMRMPVMNGEEAVRRIKMLDHSQHTCIIALTASAFDDNRTTALASGCDDFVSKPIQANAIFEKMAHHLGVRYQYEPVDTEQQQPSEPESLQQPLTIQLLRKAPTQWQQNLIQATLDLDDDAILDLVAQLPSGHEVLAKAVDYSVRNLAYKQLLQLLQEAEAVSS